MLSEYYSKITALKGELQKIEELIKLPELNDEIFRMEHHFNSEGWTDIPALQKYNKLLNKKNEYSAIRAEWNELLELIEITIEEDEVSLIEEIVIGYKTLEKRINEFMLMNMFTGKYDDHNAILSIHAGSGGKEAQDWASMLMRMYLRWAEKNRYKTQTIDIQRGDFPGSVKSATIEITGENVFGLLKNEAGVHRLIRVSPFDSQGRRHTSFAAIEVLPEIIPDTSINIDPKDLRFDYFRSSGKGGQHVNTTDSAVRIVHLPTGISVECQQERSQHQNKEVAMKVLLSKLIAIKEQEHYDEISQIQGEHRQIEWGSQIRSYVFMPRQQVKDHRTNYEVGNIEAVMDGNINDFIFKGLTL